MMYKKQTLGERIYNHCRPYSYQSRSRRENNVVRIHSEINVRQEGAKLFSSDCKIIDHTHLAIEMECERNQLFYRLDLLLIK